MAGHAEERIAPASPMPSSERFVPHKYQQYCIDRIVGQENVGLYIEMGLGKTAITLMAAEKLKYEMLSVRKVLIIAPKKVAESTWEREAKKWEQTRRLTFSRVLGSAKERREALSRKADIYLINRENVKWLTSEVKTGWDFDMVVIDESTSFKSRKSQRFKALSSVLPKVKRLVELTGTPSPYGLEDLWSQIYLLDRGERLGKTFTGFRNRYFTPGPMINGVIYQYYPKPDAKDAIMGKIKDICVTMKAGDYLELPDLIEDDYPVELDSEAMEGYKSFERKLVLELPDGDEISVSSAASLTGKLLQYANGAIYDEEHKWHEVHRAKTEAFRELLEQLQGEPAIVYYGFKSDRDRILYELIASGLPFGELRTDEDVEKWNRGDYEVLLAHPASAGYGLNLQAGGHHIIWFGLTWNYELYAQANARLHRQGQKEPVIVHRMIAEGTRDEDVAKALGHKETAQEAIMESLKARIDKIREGDIDGRSKD